MFGAIIGDVIGSVYEWNNIKTTDFPLFSAQSKFTDDTVLTIAIADAILEKKDYGLTLKEYGQKYPDAGYGGMFRDWMRVASSQPYNSYGNGSAMRVSPVGFAFNTQEDVTTEAQNSAMVTHNHPEGIKGAQATALSIYMARTGSSKAQIKECISKRFGYKLDRKIADIRPHYTFDVTCQGSVPEAIIAFLESNDFEHAIRLAVSLGGDSDTIACITGGIAQAFYGEIPDEIVSEVKERLPQTFIDVVDRFNARYHRG